MIIDINWYYFGVCGKLKIYRGFIFSCRALICVLVYFQYFPMRREHVAFAACGLISLAVIMFYIDGVGDYPNFAESAKHTDVEREFNIDKHGRRENLGNIVNNTNRVRVIINAKFRTGSSFTGELFIKHSLFAYYFEPLYHFADITTGERSSEDKILWTLERLLNCTIIDTDLEAGRLNTEFWKRIVLCGFKTGKHWKMSMYPA